MIEVYLLFQNDFARYDFDQIESYLSKEEKVIRNNFVYKKDQIQYLLTRTLIRKILSNKLCIPQEAIIFDKNDFGKPYLKYPNTSISFNLSHCAGLIVLAINQNSINLGIDVENTNRLVSLNNVMPTVFVNKEISSLQLLSPLKQMDRFFDLWTLKEAYIKALGKGFHIPPQSFGFDLDKDQLIFIENSKESNFSPFHFKRFDVINQYKIAICYDGALQDLEFYQISNDWNIKSFQIPIVE